MKRIKLASLVISILSIANYKVGQAASVSRYATTSKWLVKKLVPILVSTSLAIGIPNQPSIADDWTRLADVGVKEFLVKDGRQFLRLAAPVVSAKNEVLLGSKRGSTDEAKIQENLELIRLRLEQVGVTNPTAWGSVGADEASAETLFKKRQAELISGTVNPEAAVNFVEERFKPDLSKLADSIRAKDGKTVLELDELAAADFAELRNMKLPNHGNILPYTIPEEYSSSPRLEGYATVEMKIASKKGFKVPDSFKVIPDATFQLVVDGFHAPLTAGNFVDLVDKKYYDGMPIQKAEELFVQTGKPTSGGDGYADPITKEIRTIPLELFYKQDSEPVYGVTSDDDGRATETMALPFQAYGAIGMARDNGEPDSGSSQFFFLKWKQALNPPGRNTLDGFYSCFGYVTSFNELYLDQITTDDKISSMKVTRGLENLRRRAQQ